MAWEAIQLNGENNLPVSNEDRELILKSVDTALLHSDCDPDVILNAATMVARNIKRVRTNLQAYAGRTFFRAIRRAQATDRTQTARLSNNALRQIPDPPSVYSSEERIGTSILVFELLGTLSVLDRDIVLRHMSGHKFQRIDQELNLKPRTAEFRFRICKDALRAQLTQKMRR
jgi:DNA-directed RNA polymerase specialized sigma24 family protein